MDLKILPAVAEDLSAILKLQKECYQTEAELYADFDIPPLTQTLASITEDFMNGTVILKATTDDQLIGSVRGHTKDDTTYIGRLIVKREFQNKKIGRALMAEIEARLSECKRYEIFTGSNSEKNLALYAKLKYFECKRRMINDRLTLIYLEKLRGK
jgi:ribosomal protein S18 acetylase RimI-like enzyme